MPVSIHHKPIKRAVVVCGNRTPFVRAFTQYMGLDTIDLTTEDRSWAHGLMNSIPKKWMRYFGAVYCCPPWHRIFGRELALDLGLPHSAGNALHTSLVHVQGLQAITDAVAKIEQGEADVIIAGGSDSASNATLAMPEDFVRAVAPFAMGKSKGAKGFFSMLSRLHTPQREVFPKMPRVAERSTGEVMGESAEKDGEDQWCHQRSTG